DAGRFGKPVLVTENGIADAKDRMRPGMLIAFIEAMHAAIERGVPVLGYLHWSLLDNFEWSDGFEGRFGLYAVDFERDDRPRTRRGAGGPPPGRGSAEVRPRRGRASARGGAARAAAFEAARTAR